MDITDNILDFNKICRLCLTEETVMSSIYNEEDTETSSVPLPLRIMACVSVEVSSNDGLPSQICATCLCQVDGWYKFKDLCENSDLILRKCMKNEPVQIDTISQVKSMAQEVKKYFSSQVKEESEAANQNKNLSPKKKMASAVASTGPENMNPSLISLHNYLQTLENKNRNSGILAKYEIIFDNVIEKPVKENFTKEKGQLVMNCGQVEVYQMNSGKNDNVEFKAPEPVPLETNKKNRKYKKNLRPVVKWTNVNFDDPTTLSGVGICDITANGHEIDELLYLSGGEDEEHIYEPDPKKFKFKNPIVEECIKQYEEFNKVQPPDKVERPKYQKGEEEPKPQKSEKNDSAEIRKKILGAKPSDAQQIIIEKCIYSFRLDNDGYLDIVDIIEGDEAQAKYFKGLGHHCIFCKQFVNARQNYDKHIRNEHMKNLICKVCDRQLYSLRSFLIHLAMHLGIYTFSCPICGKNLPRASSFKEHVRGHSTEKGFKCEVCEKQFTKFSNLKKHAVLHDKKRVFICEMCGFGTHQKANLEYHINSHLGQKDFMCEFCGKLFFSVQTLEYHVLTHTTPSFPCEFCKRKFRWSHKYEHHLEKCHSDKIKGFEIVEEEIEPVYLFEEYE